MKILIIANGLIGSDPSPSGGDVRFFQLAKYWHSMGYDIHILSSLSAQKLIDKFELKATLHVLPGASYDVGRNSFIYRALQALFIVPKSLDDYGEGIVYTANDSVFDVFSGFRLKLRLGKKIRWSAIVHWLPPFPPWKRKQSTVMNSILFYINERISIFLANRFADVLLPVSESTARQLKDAKKDMSKVFPVKCGVDYQTIRKYVSNVEKKYDAVFMKRLQGVKGVFDLADIWRQVVEKKPDAKLVVIGDEGEDVVRVRNLINEFGLKNNIHFTGYIYDVEEKFKILGSSKVFILPSYEENWAISLGEAIAAGLPTIAYNLDELLDVWKNNTCWVELGDTKIFAEKILEVIKEDASVSERVSNGLKFIQKLDWEVLAEEEINIMTNDMQYIS